MSTLRRERDLRLGETAGPGRISRDLSGLRPVVRPVRIGMRDTQCDRDSCRPRRNPLGLCRAELVAAGCGSDPRNLLGVHGSTDNTLAAGFPPRSSSRSGGSVLFRHFVRGPVSRRGVAAEMKPASDIAAHHGRVASEPATRRSPQSVCGDRWNGFRSADSADALQDSLQAPRPWRGRGLSSNVERQSDQLAHACSRAREAEWTRPTAAYRFRRTSALRRDPC